MVALAGVRRAGCSGAWALMPSAEELAQGTHKHVQGSCGAVQGYGASAMAEQGCALRRKRRRAAHHHLEGNLGKTN